MVLRRLSELEQSVMDHVWAHPRSTADACREALARPLKESTVRTMLHRLEQKGFVSHEVEGRTFLYSACRARDAVAAHAVKQIADRFCAGSVEQLLVGIVDAEFLDQQELERLAERISQKKKERQ